MLLTEADELEQLGDAPSARSARSSYGSCTMEGQRDDLLDRLAPVERGDTDPGTRSASSAAARRNSPRRCASNTSLSFEERRGPPWAGRGGAAAARASTCPIPTRRRARASHPSRCSSDTPSTARTTRPERRLPGRKCRVRSSAWTSGRSVPSPAGPARARSRHPPTPIGLWHSNSMLPCARSDRRRLALVQTSGARGAARVERTAARQALQQRRLAGDRGDRLAVIVSSRQIDSSERSRVRVHGPGRGRRRACRSPRTGRRT